VTPTCSKIPSSAGTIIDRISSAPASSESEVPISLHRPYLLSPRRRVSGFPCVHLTDFHSGPDVGVDRARIVTAQWTANRSASLALTQTLPGSGVRTHQQDVDDLWVISHCVGQLFSYVGKITPPCWCRSCVRCPALDSCPHRSEIAFGWRVLPWRRIGHFEEIAVYQTI
jgi:hypothetical protein